MRKLFTILLLVVAQFSIAQTLQSPSEFVGYSWGSRFTPHHQVVNYLEYVARILPNSVKIVRYGSTYEGRPLMVAIIANEQNLREIEEIRTNNLKSIGLLSGTPSKKQPAITWLSYNVHGNEACATTAAIQAFYDLVRKDNPIAQQVLANSVVIMDLCLNPDGYDRYVNWYNQKVGRKANPFTFSVEHFEPWPGGRPNHYYFDLNRDWAWQTQKETQERIAFYNSWMPHLHADFHEQGLNSPYYFPPSAKPYHEDITQWQREMQNVVGEYERKYFDKNGWLYFTRENFDLFYPSYGDTYPTYNGAIGYTLEQGGSGRAGLAVMTDAGDTLTLKQRADHHAASSWAAMEAVSSRADKVVSEFVKFYDNAKTNPVGTFKSFVIKTKGDEAKIKAFTGFLDKQGFQYGYGGKELMTMGYSYQEDKQVNFKVEAEDVVINLYQPRSTYLKILLEPKSALEDSVTYDITSWSLPYAYGLKAFGVKEKLTPQAKPTGKTEIKNVEKPYAYVVRWQTVDDVAFLGHILNKKIKVRAAEKPFELDGQQFAAGTLLIVRAGNEAMGAQFDKIVKDEAEDHGITLYPATTGFVTKGSDFGSGNVNVLKAPKIAVLSGEGTSSTSVGDVWHFFDQQVKYPAAMISPDMLGSIDLKLFDVIVMPSGGYGRALNERTLTSLKDWIRGGGKLIAMESAVGALSGKPDFNIKVKEEEKKKDDKAKESNPTDDLKQYGNREREFVMEETPGSIYKVTMDNTHPLGFGYDKTYFGLLLEASNYAFLKEGWNVGYTGKNAIVAGFAGKNARKKLENSLIYGVQDMGRGKVIYLVNNPLFRGFWYNGKLLFGNAVFMVN